MLKRSLREELTTNSLSFLETSRTRLDLTTGVDSVEVCMLDDSESIPRSVAKVRAFLHIISKHEPSFRFFRASWVDKIQNIYKFLATPAHGAKQFRGGHSLVKGGHGHPGPPPNGATEHNYTYNFQYIIVVSICGGKIIYNLKIT